MLFKNIRKGLGGKNGHETRVNWEGGSGILGLGPRRQTRERESKHADNEAAIGEALACEKTGDRLKKKRGL